MNPPLLLVVDDEIGVRESLKMVLGKEFRLIEADSVDAAICKVEQARPDVVLLDMVMPKSDGLVLLHRIKEIHPACAVIILTGLNSQQLAAKAVGASSRQCYRWKSRRAIPGSWHLKLLMACQRRGIRLTQGELLKQHRNGRAK